MCGGFITHLNATEATLSLFSYIIERIDLNPRIPELSKLVLISQCYMFLIDVSELNEVNHHKVNGSVSYFKQEICFSIFFL